MKYRVSGYQIWRKKLEGVPLEVVHSINSNRVSLENYVKYNLENEVSIYCLNSLDRELVDRFGIGKIKKLDFELLNNNSSYKEYLLNISPLVEDINGSLYELVKDKISPDKYSSRMKEVYSDRLFDIDLLRDQNVDEEFLREAKLFNEGYSSLQAMVNNWDMFKEKDLSYCLLKNFRNIYKITDEQLKDFMNRYGEMVPLILKNSDIYSFISEFSFLGNELEKQEYINRFADDILEQTIKFKDSMQQIKLSNIEYRKLFKYASKGPRDYLIACSGSNNVNEIFDELKTLSDDYLFDNSIPFELFKSYDVVCFVGTYGLKNIIDFDNECGHFFTKNNCEMLKLMYDMYLYYAGNVHDLNKSITAKKNVFDENGNYVDRPYTKDEFYESMRRMIVYGPTDKYYIDKIPDYGCITGEFREKNADLFISEDAPEDLQKAFYTKSITPGLLFEHPDYVFHLYNKNFESCFKSIMINAELKDDNGIYGYENFYGFLASKMDFNKMVDFIVENSFLLDFLFNKENKFYFMDKTKFSYKDSIGDIEDKIYDCFKKILIEKGVIYPKNISDRMKIKYSDMFLSSSVDAKLQEVFYNRRIDASFILSNPQYIEDLKKVDLRLLYKFMPVSYNNGEEIRSIGLGYSGFKQTNVVEIIMDKFGKDKAFDVMLVYGKYLGRAFDSNSSLFTYETKFYSSDSANDVLNRLDDILYKSIISGKMKYDENISQHFKDNYPMLFLDESIPSDIRDKFYNKELTLEDFKNNSELLVQFGNTNVILGFSGDFSWMFSLFNEMEDSYVANFNRLKVFSEYSKISDVNLQLFFKNYILKNGSSINMEKIECVSEVLSRLSLSNSSELYNFREVLAGQILNTSDPIKSLDKIENIFIKNNVPTIGKIYSCFEILHPDFEGFNFLDSMVSPVLKKKSTKGKKVMVFSDLIKAEFGSNNRSVNAYLRILEQGSNLYENIKNGQIQYDVLDIESKNMLIKFSKCLSTLYNNSLKGKEGVLNFEHTDNVILDIENLSRLLSPNGNLDYNLADRAISMFCHYAGFDKLSEVKQYIKTKIEVADIRNRKAAESDLILNKGDFVKGIGDITYLGKILQNGSVAREYLGASAGSDATPLDTDVSMITDSFGTVEDKIDGTAAKNYGPIWFVLKNDDRFITTRTNGQTMDDNVDLSKLEVFYTGVLGSGHYGIRTGFASSEIDYIVLEDYDPRAGMEIVKNGFYIPIANKDGKIVFTPDDYDKLRQKMVGLSYYGENNYVFSENLVTEETNNLALQVEQSNYEVQLKRTKINKAIKESLDELGLQLKTNIDGDLTEGIVELIDTGSTGRGTNKPGDGDFDFMMRLDKSILSDSEKLELLKKTLLKKFGKDSSDIIGTGDFRLKEVQIDSETEVDIDITFIGKSDNVSYSTDMALQDRLATIYKADPKKYKYVVANILLAKQVLKKAEAYKPNRGETPQGGLGGVGIENWILQNGGSFIDAARSFVEASSGKNFDEFKKNYQIWDFGENYLAERRGQYIHDNFVQCNMSSEGYEKMRSALKSYVNNFNNEQIKTVKGFNK